jgi:hypothetical protein
VKRRETVGWFIRRTWKEPVPIGKTIRMETHDLYPTREEAEANLPKPSPRDRYTYDVAEAWMYVEEEP